MPERGPFPAPDGAFNTYANTASKYLRDNKDRLKVDDDQLTGLGNLMEQWNGIFPDSQNKDKRTKSITDDKNKLRPVLEDQFRLIYGDIPQSKLTVNDRNTLNLKARDLTPTPVPVADDAPGIEMEKNIHLQQVIRFVNPKDKESRKIPEGYKRILESYIGDKGLKADDIPFGNSKLCSRFLKTINFTEAQTGKCAYYRACYVNTKGEEGSWSDVFFRVIA